MDLSLAAAAQAQKTDEEIIQDILSGRKHLFELLMRKYNARLYRVAMSIINDDMEAEDIMQSTYLKAYEKLSSFEQRSSFGTWITRILINESLLRLRKRKRQDYMEEEQSIQDKTGSTPMHKLMNKELSNALETALVQLPEKYRLVFVLREVEDLSIAETVSTLGITEANVKVRLNRAKSMLRDTLSTYYKGDSVYHFHLTRCDRIVNAVMQQLGIAASA